MPPAPLVSVVMPVFNGARFLERAITSVLVQTMPDFELIVVDDGSTDATPELLRALARGDARIRVLRKTNSGISETLNLGLEVAQGLWIARLDADDEMRPNRLERQLAFVAAHQSVVAAGSDFDLIDSDDRVQGSLAPLPRSALELHHLFEAHAAIAFTHPTMIYQRTLALALGGYHREDEPCEDADLFARMMASGGLILIQPEVLTRYRVHPGAISRQSTRQQFFRLRYIYRNFYAAREGRPVVAFPEYEAELRALSPLKRVRLRLDLAAEHLYRAYTMARVEGRRLPALAYLAGAGLLRPVKALKRGTRAALARLRRKAEVTGAGALWRTSSDRVKAWRRASTRLPPKST